jgi:hypothetical protein
MGFPVPFVSPAVSAIAWRAELINSTEAEVDAIAVVAATGGLDCKQKGVTTCCATTLA